MGREMAAILLDVLKPAMAAILGESGGGEAVDGETGSPVALGGKDIMSRGRTRARQDCDERAKGRECVHEITRLTVLVQLLIWVPLVRLVRAPN